MESFFNPESDIMTFLSRVGDLVIANILWLITSIPIFTLGASTAALYAVVKTPGEKQYSSSVVKNYFQAFVKNFRKATLAMIALLIPAGIIFVNLYILVMGMLEDSLIRYIICAIPVVLLVFAWNYVFPLIASYENTLRKTFANAFLLSVAHLPTTLILTALNLLPIACFLFLTNFFYRFFIVWVLIGFSLIMKINSLLLERVFRKYNPIPQT